ncbi:MAG: SAM-dependent methyltransferase, partial [Planctomycetales bacterium]|nr:SAM-dependent methyltransferase [Planctomycetales bacterium]
LWLFRDLLRPIDEATLQRLVEQYAADADSHQRQLFADSLRAALTVDEVGRLAVELGLSPDDVRQTSDRHWTWTTRKH